MAWMRSLRSWVLLFFGVFLLEFGFVSSAVSGPNAPTSIPGNRFEIAQFFEPPPGSPETPNETLGGGRRGSGICRNIQPLSEESAAKQSLTQLLIPVIPANRWGLTIEEHPTVLVYIPKVSASKAEFTLEKSDGERVATKVMGIDGTPRIYSVTLSSDDPGLEVDEDYRWIFSLICGSGDPGDPFVTGRVHRIVPDTTLRKKLEQATPLSRIELYASAGIWYEAVADMAQLRHAQPQAPTVMTAWQKLLTSVNLGDLSGEMIEINSAKPQAEGGDRGSNR